MKSVKFTNREIVTLIRVAFSVSKLKAAASSDQLLLLSCKTQQVTMVVTYK